MIRRVLSTSILFLLCSSLAFAEPPQRIVSLAPSITELLYALGLGDRIVGVTNFCDYPSEARLKPKMGGMSNPSLEAVVSARPDIVIMTTDGNPKEFRSRLENLHIKTFLFTARTIPALPQGIRELASALCAVASGEKLASGIEHSLKELESEPKPGGGRKALFIIWPEPLIAAGPGTQIDDALKLLGFRNIASDARSQYPKYSIEEVISRAPDIIFLGKSMNEDTKELSKPLLKKLRILRAVREGEIYYTGDRLFRLGPRVLDGIADLRQLLRGKK